MSIKFPTASSTKGGLILSTSQTIGGSKTLTASSGTLQFHVDNTGTTTSDHSELKLRTATGGGNARILLVPQLGQGWVIGLTADDVLKFARNATGDLATNIYGQMSSAGAWTLGATSSTQTHLLNAGKVDITVTGNNFAEKTSTGARFQTNTGGTTCSLTLRASETTVPANTLIFSIPSASDTGAVAVANIDVRNDASGTIGTRPLLSFTNGFSTSYGMISATGGWTFGTSSTVQHALNGVGQNANALLAINCSANNAFTWATQAFAPSLTSGNNIVHFIGVAGNTNNSGYIGFKYNSSGSSSNSLRFGLFNNNDLMSIEGGGVITIGATNATVAHVLNGTLLSNTELAQAGSFNGTSLNVAGYSNLRLNTAIAGITFGLNGGVNGQTLTIYTSSGSNPITLSATGSAQTIHIAGGSFALANGNTITLKFLVGAWYELCRTTAS